MNNQNGCTCGRCSNEPRKEVKIERKISVKINEEIDRKTDNLVQRLDTLFCELDLENQVVASACLSIFMKCCKIQELNPDQVKRELDEFLGHYINEFCKAPWERKYE